jgi:N-acyl-L-homoserine lactone synthetase
VTLAASDSDRTAAFRLRCRCALDQGWARRDQFADGIERDTWDNDAVHILAWAGDRLAGTVRLVLPADGRPLPTEAAFGLRVEPAGAVVDGGRLVVAPAHRAAGRPSERDVLALLLARLWIETVDRGFDRVLAAAPRAAVSLYRRLGLRVDVVGAPRLAWGEERSPVVIRGTGAAFPA